MCCPGDQLLVNKQHAELLQPYQQRMDASVAYMRAIRPCPLEVTGGALLDPKVRTVTCTLLYVEVWLMVQAAESTALQSVGLSATCKAL